MTPRLKGISRSRYKNICRQGSENADGTNSISLHLVEPFPPTLPLTLPILLGQECVKRVSRNHRSNPGALLTYFPGGLIKVWWEHIYPFKDCSCCPRDRIDISIPQSRQEHSLPERISCGGCSKKLPPGPILPWYTPSVCPHTHHSPPTLVGLIHRGPSP